VIYRARTVREMERSYQRREETLLGIIEKLNDRLMFLVDRPWEPPPIMFQEERVATAVPFDADPSPFDGDYD